MTAFRTPSLVRRHSRTFRPGTQAQSAHLIGVCGSGMKALAELLLDMGWKVTGSDLQPPGSRLAKIAARGLRIHQGHDHDELASSASVVVHSPAVDASNPELRRAVAQGVEVLSYSEMLGRLTQDKTGISIAGTHGKSTTSAMVADVLAGGQRSPSAIIGAESRMSGRSGWAGTGSEFVVESCEYNGNFLNLHPKLAVLTGIEPDHFDCFGSFDESIDVFTRFASSLPQDGCLIVNSDCQAARDVAQAATAEVISFSQSPGRDWWATDLKQTVDGTRFRVFRGETFHGEFSLSVPGEHNVRNALGAIALADCLGIAVGDVRESLSEFAGIRRRFEHVGSWRGITLIDDYAHHPTAVQVSLQTARQVFGKRRVWCAFQPHQASRTRRLMNEFAASFAQADQVLVAPVFAAREVLADGEGRQLANQLAEEISANCCEARAMESLDRMIATLDHEARPGDVLITMGAGNIDQVHHEFHRRLQRHPA